MSENEFKMRNAKCKMEDRSTPNIHPMGAGHLAKAEKEITVEPYIDKHEVARRLGNTTRTVDSMMRRGLIPYYKFGYRVAFRWSEIESHLVESCRVEARAEQTIHKQTQNQKHFGGTPK
jgi:hypothetical protein